MIYRIADLAVEIRARYDYVTRQCADYLAPLGTVPDFTVEVSDEVLSASHAQAPDFSVAYHESLCVYRAICQKMLDYGGFLLHAAVIEVDGRAYAFSAPSGTGKSTHIKLWRRVLGERVQIVNGDKPILRYRDGRFMGMPCPFGGIIYPFAIDPKNQGSKRDKNTFRFAKIVCLSKDFNLKINWGTQTPFVIEDPITREAYQVGGSGNETVP